MAANKDGGQAFPHGDPTNGGDVGMSLRDYFAWQAIGRIVIDNDEEPEDQPTDEMVRWIEWQATYAYAVADAMLKAREAQP